MGRGSWGEGVEGVFEISLQDVMDVDFFAVAKLVTLD